jgi:hypothetical protein
MKGVLLFTLFGLILFLMAHTTRSQSKSPAADNSVGAQKNVAPSRHAKKLSAAAAQWVETTLANMTLDEKVGQVIFALMPR